MRPRTIFACFIAMSGQLMAIPALAQDSPGKRLAAVVAVAVEEYRLGVDSRGKVVALQELDEAREALVDARDVAKRLSGDSALRVAALVDSLASAMRRDSPPAKVDAMY